MLALAAALTDTRRNMDLQISMKAASEDDCTLGEGFAGELPPCHLPLWVQPMKKHACVCVPWL